MEKEWFLWNVLLIKRYLKAISEWVLREDSGEIFEVKLDEKRTRRNRLLAICQYVKTLMELFLDIYALDKQLFMS